MGFWDWLRSDAPRYRVVHIPIAESKTAAAEKHYVKVWLTEMMLKDGRTLFDSYTPAVHASVRFRAGDREAVLESISGPPSLPGLEKIEGDVLHGRHPLTGYTPFKGGETTLGVGLAAYRRSDSSTDAFIALLGQLSGMLKQPALGKLEKVAGPLREGIQRLGGAGDKRLHLSFHGTYSGRAADGGRPLSSGYIAVVREEIDPESLTVRDDGLYRDGAPLRGVDAMLLCIEVSEHRADWAAFGTWSALCEQAVDASFDGKDGEAEELLKEAVTAVRRSPDLTRLDKRRVAKALRDQFAAEIGGGFEMAGSSGGSFMERAMKAAVSHAAAENLPDP